MKDFKVFKIYLDNLVIFLNAKCNIKLYSWEYDDRLR